MSDIFIKLEYPIARPEDFGVKTNAKSEVVADLLADFLHAQIGAGADQRPPGDYDIYEITLLLDLSDDSWRVQSNTNNHGLTAGIVMDVLKRLNASMKEVKEISEAEARSLILSGAAGYWGCHERTVPLEHDQQTVVRLRGKLWLAPASQFRVEFVEMSGVVGGRAKGTFSVECNNKFIEQMAQDEMTDRTVTLDEQGRKFVVEPDGSHRHASDN